MELDKDKIEAALANAVSNANGTPKRKTFYGHTMKVAEGKRAEYEE